MKKAVHTGSCLGGASIFAAALFMAPVSKAHHSSAMYDDKQSITIEGAVTKFEWSNPHVYVYLKQLTAAGEPVEWELEASPPSMLRRHLIRSQRRTGALDECRCPDLKRITKGDGVVLIDGEFDDAQRIIHMDVSMLMACLPAPASTWSNG